MKCPEHVQNAIRRGEARQPRDGLADQGATDPGAEHVLANLPALAALLPSPQAQGRAALFPEDNDRILGRCEGGKIACADGIGAVRISSLKDE